MASSDESSVASDHDLSSDDETQVKDLIQNAKHNKYHCFAFRLLFVRI